MLILEFVLLFLFGLHLDVDVYASGHLQSGQCINSLLIGSNDIDQSLVSSLLELLSGILILVNSTKDGNYLLLGGQRYRTTHLSSVFLYSFR